MRETFFLDGKKQFLANIEEAHDRVQSAHPGSIRGGSMAAWSWTRDGWIVAEAWAATRRGWWLKIATDAGIRGAR
jgi:hypothetical protein